MLRRWRSTAAGAGYERPSESSELRLTLLGKCLRSFMSVWMSKHPLADLDLEIDHVLPALAGIERDGFAGGLDCKRRCSGDAFRGDHRFLCEIGLRHDLCDKPEIVGGLRIEIMTEKQYVERAAASDIARKAGQPHAPTWDHTDIGIGGAEYGVIGCDAEVARPAECGTTANAVAVDRCDNGKREVLEAVERISAQRLECPGALRSSEVRPFPQITPGPQSLVSRPRPDHPPLVPLSFSL